MEAFVEAWSEFAAWARPRAGRWQLQLARDLNEEGRYISFGDWTSEDAVRRWKSSAEFKERLAQVVQHVSDFQSTQLGLVATAENGESTGTPATVHYEKDGVAIFAAPVERIFEYMRAGNHPHQSLQKLPTHRRR